MKKLWVLVLIAAVAIIVARHLGRSRAPAGDPEDPVKAYFEAVTKGDVNAALECVDLKECYDKREGGRQSYDEYVNTVRLALGLRFTFERKQVREAFEYRIIGVQEKDNISIVEIRTRPNAESPWKADKIAVGAVGGQWKITAEGWGKLIDAQAPAPASQRGAGTG